MVTLNYYHNKSEKYVTGNRNNYLHCLACMYNRYGVPQEEAAAFIKSQFTDLPADEMDALILVDEITFNGSLSGKLKVKGLI